jgi:hypothetical protein
MNLRQPLAGALTCASKQMILPEKALALFKAAWKLFQSGRQIQRTKLMFATIIGRWNFVFSSYFTSKFHQLD